MKLIKTASGNQIELSKSEWETIGCTAGWIKVARGKCPSCGDELGRHPDGEGPECSCGWWAGAEQCENCEKFVYESEIKDGRCKECLGE